VTLSRRAFVGRAAMLAAAALAPLPAAAARAGLVGAGAAAAPGDFVLETLDGVVAYVVPGDDRHSTAQGVSTRRAGGVAARGGEGLRATLEAAGPGTADAAVAVLNGFARAVDPRADVRAGTLGFSAPFAALSSRAKTEVFVRLSRSPEDAIRQLGAILPALAAFVSYSEFGVLDSDPPSRPVGWQITGYDGVADGRDELRGYYRGRRRARTRAQRA
jgi:hypothetical protein